MSAQVVEVLNVPSEDNVDFCLAEKNDANCDIVVDFYLDDTSDIENITHIDVISRQYE